MIESALSLSKAAVEKVMFVAGTANAHPASAVGIMCYASSRVFYSIDPKTGGYFAQFPAPQGYSKRSRKARVAEPNSLLGLMHFANTSVVITKQLLNPCVLPPKEVVSRMEPSRTGLCHGWAGL